MTSFSLLTKNGITHALPSDDHDGIAALRQEGFLLSDTQITAETALEAVEVHRFDNGSKKMGKLAQWILGAFLLVVVLFGYGFGKGHYDMSSGRLSIFTAAMTVSGMNPITAEGYRVALNSYSVFRSRVNSIQSLGN